MTTAAQGDPLRHRQPPLLGPVLGSLPNLVFPGRGCAAAVAATALMQWAKRTKRTYPGRHQSLLPPLCLKEACSHAAGGGNREVLEWLHNTGCPWDAETASAAASGGHLEILQWAREHGCLWDSRTCASAALSGHLRVLQWAREHHCPWNWATPALAAEGGHLTVLQWAWGNDCPWDSHVVCPSYVCVSAAKGGHLEVLQWLRENEAPDNAWNEYLVRTYAGGPRKQEVLTWLDGLSAP